MAEACCLWGAKSTAGLATSILWARGLSGVEVAALGGVWEEVWAGLGGVWEGVGVGLGGVWEVVEAGLAGVWEGDFVPASGWLVVVLGCGLLSDAGRPLMPELARCSLCLAKEKGAEVLLTLSFTLS